MAEGAEPTVKSRSHPIGSVRFRITAAVSMLFGVTIILASVFFVARVKGSLVDDIYAQDTQTLQDYSQQLHQAALTGELTPPGNRPGTQIQVLDEQGRIMASTPGANAMPFDPRLAGHGPPFPPGMGPDGPQGPVPFGGPNAPPNAPPNGPPNAPPNRPNGEALGPNGQPLDPALAPVGAGRGPLNTVVANPSRGVSGPRSPDLAVSVVPVSTPSGPVSLITATSLDGVRQSVDALVQGLRIAIPALVLSMAVAAWFIIGRALRPVAQITARVQAISAHTLHERVPEPRSRDEIGHLAATMNAMLERLEVSSTRQRQFISDASHELRTPVSTIKTELEVALLHPDLTDWPDVARSVLAEDERLEQIVSDLLMLARFDEQPRIDPGQAIAVDLDDIVRTDARRARRLPVDTAAVQPVRVAGRADELSRMVAHLLDNAARHGATRVRVSLAADQVMDDPDDPHAVAGELGEPVGLGACLVVEDDGAGVPAPQQDRIFQRFGRLEEGRSRDSGGAGLGLSVVRKIAERHGGSVRVANSETGGARFEVRLPI